MSLDKKLFGIASSAVNAQRKVRDSRNPLSKGLDIATNKSYANEDKKTAAAALRKWENTVWKPKVAAKLKQELKTRAPHLKPGTKAYQDTYNSLYNKNYRDLQSAKTKAQQKLGTLRQPKQTQRQLDNEYRQNEAIRNKSSTAQAVAHTIRDTGEATAGALATGASRTLRYPLQLAADVGENDDGGIFDRGAKALERHEKNLQKVYPAYADIQQNGNFGQKLALSAVEQVPNLALSFTGAGAAAKGAQVLGAGAKTTAAVSYGTAAATMYPQAYGDGSDSTKQELENATPEQLATAVRSKDIYKSHFDKNLKAGMSEDEAHKKSRDQTISSIAEESGDAVGLATLALSMIAPGVGSFTANRVAGGAVSQWGQKVFNTLAVKADAGKVAKIAVPTAVGAGIVGLNVTEEALQEGYTDYKAQQAAVDVGVKNKIDEAQLKESMLMGGVLGGFMGGGVYVSTRNSKLHQAQDSLKEAQQTYAEVANQIPQIQAQIESVSPRSPEGQALTAKLAETRTALDTMVAEAEKVGIPRSSLARHAPRIDPTNSFDTEFDGGVDGATEMDAESFEDALNPDGAPDAAQQAPAAQQEPVVQPMSEKERDAQDVQIAELIAEQAALDEAIEDGSNEKPLEESIAAAQSWYDSKRGEGKQGLAGVVSRAAATEQDTAFAQKQEAIKGATASINDYIASERAKQQQLDAELEQDALAAKTEREKKEVERRIKQREIDRAQEDELLATREQLAQPYEKESFDTTIVGADGAPFNLARFWDSNMLATAKAKAIADAFGGQVEQNVAKADWRSMPEGVQKELHQWFSEPLDGVRQSREGGEQTAEQEVAPAVEQPQAATPTAGGLTMPVQQSVVEQAPIAPVEEQTPIAPVEVEQAAEIDSTPAATQLTDENPVINIPAPTQAKAETPAPTTDEGIYKSKPAAKAAIKKQKLDPDSVTIKQVKGGGFEIVPNAPAKPSYAQAQEQAATELGMTINEDGEYGGTDAEFETFAKRVDEIQGRSLSNSKPTPKQNTAASTDDVAIGKDGNAKWFGSNDKAQAFIDKKGISDTHEVVSAGKSRFEIQPKAEGTPQADVAKAETVLESQDNYERKLVAGDRVTARNNNEYEITNVEFNSSGGVNSVSTLFIPNPNSPNADKSFSPQRRSIAEFNNMFGSRVGSFEAPSATQSPKNITDEQFAELTSSRTTPSTPTGEQSAPAKRAAAKKAATQKTQNDVSKTTAPKRKTAAELRASLLDKNKVVTKEQADEFRETLKSSVGTLNSGFDPKAAFAAMGLAAAYIEGGIRNFTDFATLLVDDAGVKVKKYLLPAWEAARAYDDLDTEGMTSTEDARADFEQLVADGFFDEEAQAEQISAPAKSDTPKKVGSGTQAKTLIGENNEGLPLYEDDRGVRSILEHGIIYVNESVNITPTGIEQNPREQRYLTKEELAQESNNDTEAGTQDKAGAQEVRARGSDPQSGNAQDDNGDVAQGQPTDDSATGQGESTGRSSVRGAGTDVADDGAVPGSENATDGRKGASGEGAPNAGAGKSATGSQSGRVAAVKSPAATAAQATDLLIDNPLDIVGGTPVQRFNRNRAALELLDQLEVEGRQATTEEQKVLAAYIGWGSFGQDLFQGSWEYPKYRDEGVWKERSEWLRNMMGKENWESAQRSITNAHYTDPPTVMAMWDMLARMGFDGGRVLEPSMGTGNFFSMMPADIKSRSQLTGIELDEMTGAIAKQLFPQSNVQIMGYQDSKTPDNFYDVVVGNWPFENTPVADRKYNKFNPMLHDYFFLKTMDQVRPGGIVIGITSAGSMDKKNAVIRGELAKQAELISAIRLPSGAFKDYAGTSVVTDIVILRKRPEKLGIIPQDATWVDVAPYKTPSGEEITVNQYYIDNPKNVIGTLDYGHGTTTFRPGMIVHRPDNMSERLQQAIELVPENVIQEDTTTDHITYYANKTGERHGSLFMQDDKLMLVRGDQAVLAQDVVKYEVKSEKTTKERESQIKDAIDLRRKYSALIDAERANEPAETQRKALKDAYKSFVKSNGPLRDSYALKYMLKANDPFYFELAALEDDAGNHAAIMDKSTTRGMKTLENPSIRDAYVLARNQSVSPSVKEIAKLSKKTEAEVKRELKESGAVIEAPNGDLIPSDIYLSGNVRQKLREAQAAFDDGNKAMKENIAALQNVVPEDIPYFNIETKLGATWVPIESYQDYLASMLGLDSSDGIEVTFVAGRWKVRLKTGMDHTSAARTNYGTAHYKFSDLAQAAIRNQTIKIMKTDPQGVKYYDAEASNEVNARIGKIREDFGTWLWSDPERRVDLEREYNESRNAWATPKYDGSFLTFEGMALTLGQGEFNLREHQANAIWRAIVNRRSLNAHEVGTGKTFTMGGIAIESRRYGIAKKPIILAHNANSAAVAAEIRMMYPSSRVLYIDNLEPKHRELRLRQIANDDWDAIVMPHSLVDRLSLTEETLMRMAADDIAALEAEFYAAAAEAGIDVSKVDLDDEESVSKVRSRTAKEMAKTRKRVIEGIKKQAQQASKASAVSFEDLGIDMILVDEVHEFKKPPIVTSMDMKGLNTDVSQRSIQLQFLTRYVRQMNNGGNVHTFTGTPITNTITEIYHQMRYVMDSEMEKVSVSDWDGWFGSFATEVQDVELTSAGDYEMTTRLAGFINVPELRQMVGQYMDTVFAEDMPEMQPRRTDSGKTMADDNLTEKEKAHLLNGRTEGAKDRPYKKVINDTADMTPLQEAAFAEVQRLAGEWRDASGKEKREWVNKNDPRAPFAYTNMAEKASADVRLLDPSLVGKEGQTNDDPNSKTSRAIRNIMEIYHSDKDANQVVFMDKGYNKTATRSTGNRDENKKMIYEKVDVFSPVADMVERLVQSGIPREQIAVVTGSTKKEDRHRIAQAVNNSEIRVVIGSTQTLGVGVNMQRNLRAMHHMDAPYMPGELEQRNGRGQRQGNQWNTVLEYRYMTDRLDGKRWQILAVKQRFITAFMKSRGDTRTIEGEAAAEEQSDILESFSEAAGDPRVLQRVKLQGKQDSLKNKERIYTRGIADMKREIRSQKDRAAKGKEALAKLDTKIVADTLQAQRDSFKATIGGKSFDKRADAIEAANKFIEDNLRLGTGKLLEVGTYAGIPLKADWNHSDKEYKSIIDLGGHRFVGNGIAGLEAVMRNFPKFIEKSQADIDKANATVKNLEKALDQPFGQAQDLERNIKQLADLQKDLEMNPVPPPAWLRQGAPMDSEVYRNKAPFIVTGHRYDSNGWFVMAEDSKGQVAIPYLEAKDASGMALYDEKDFVAPEVTENKRGKDGKKPDGKNDNELEIDIEADRVPNSDSNRPTLDDMPKYSKTNPAKGNTGTTAKQVVSTLQKRFGKEVVAALIKSGKLRVRTLNDFVNADGRLLIPSDAEGFYYDGKVTLIADNLTDDTAVATLLHELGGHAGIQNMLETQTYMGLMENFYDLVRSGNKYAVRAKERAEAMTGSDSEARDEYIPYLITEYAQATERGGPLAVIKRFVNRVMAGVRAWVRNHTGVQLKMTPNDMVQLAERMVKRLAEQSMDSVTIAGVENMPAAQMQFSQDSVEQANTPAFREWFDANNPDTRFSRRYSSLGTDGKPVTAKERARDRVALAQATTMSSKFGINLLLRRHLATPQHVALLNPVFKIFTDNVQARIAYENNEAGLVQTLLPEIWDTRLVVGKKKEAMERVSTALFDGTMADQVWTDSELETKFNLTRQDIGFYRRARRAIDTSVMNMTVDTLSSLAKGTKLVNIETIHKLKLQGMHPIFHNLVLQQYMTDELEKLAKGGLITPKAEARLQKQLDDVFDVMAAIAMKYDKLVADGYAPLMRFGHYAVEVRDKVSNDLDLFELYETKGQQRKAIKELKERYDETQFTVGTGTLNPEGFKQFKNKGLSPETVQLFAAELGLDDDGAYQAYLKIAVSDRSALKRLIHRKKVPGYSEDMPRVLSAFVMSNARYSGRGLYNSEIERSIQDIEDGNLQNEAQKVFENMENPQEEFAGTRSMMFHYFMGFSPAFLFLNLTQPFTQTIPKLTAYAGAARAHAYMAQALAMVGKHAGSAAINMGKKVAGLPTPSWTGFEDNLPAWVKKEDYLRMAREGHLDPQNIYMIKGLERGKGGVASGVWGNIEAAAGWPAEISESMNRRSTMIAAFRVAKDMGDAKLKAKGFDSKYEFAVSIIQQTQGIYNKGNRSGLARGNGKLGQYGPLILVFKQFTINYTEQMIRHGRDKEVKALAVAMMWQFALAGMLGLPFADDLRDLFEGIAYRVFGKAFNLPDYLEGLLGKSNADALMYGIASEKGRIDLFGRSSLGNVIPGTDVIRPGPTDWAEILGASSGFYESFFSAASMAAEGKYKDAIITASPRYIRDAASGAEIAITGSYRNTKGDKIMDLDKTDAVIKSLAFNPSNNARPGRDRSNAYDMKNMLKAKTDYFSKHLAEAIYQEDDERVDKLYDEMDKWNNRNAEHFNVDIDKIEASAEKRVERKDFGSDERQNIQDSLAERQEDLAGT